MAQQLANPRVADWTWATVQITTNATGVSDFIPLGGYELVGIQNSSAWTAAKIGFNASFDGSTNVQPVTDNTGIPLTVTMSSANFTAIPNTLGIRSLRNIQLVSETSAGVAVAQGQVVTLGLALAQYGTKG